MSGSGSWIVHNSDTRCAAQRRTYPFTRISERRGTFACYERTSSSSTLHVDQLQLTIPSISFNRTMYCTLTASAAIDNGDYVHALSRVNRHRRLDAANYT